MSEHEIRLLNLEGLMNKLEKELGNKLNVRIFLAIVVIAMAVLGFFGNAIWDMNNSMHNGFTEVTKEVSGVKVEVSGLTSDVNNMKDNVRLIQEAMQRDP